MLIAPPFLDPNPFDAEPAHPIALVPALITPLRARAARDLRRLLPLAGPPDGTVRWQTPGLDPAVAEHRARYDTPSGQWARKWIDDSGFQHRVDRIGGLVTLAANPTRLKAWGTWISMLGDWTYRGSADIELDFPDRNGDVQVLRGYGRRVSAARVARREILAEMPAPRPWETLNPLIWDRGTTVRGPPSRRPPSHAPSRSAPRGVLLPGRTPCFKIQASVVLLGRVWGGLDHHGEGACCGPRTRRDAPGQRTRPAPDRGPASTAVPASP